jgi:hypothetical protein
VVFLGGKKFEKVEDESPTKLYCLNSPAALLATLVMHIATKFERMLEREKKKKRERKLTEKRKRKGGSSGDLFLQIQGMLIHHQPFLHISMHVVCPSVGCSVNPSANTARTEPSGFGKRNPDQGYAT